MGTGDRVALEINAGKFSKSYTFAHTDPYTTIDNVSRTTSFTYRDITQFVAASSAFSTKQITGAVQWSYPISEYQYLTAGTAANKNTLVVSQGYSAQQAVDWVKNNGNTFQRSLEDTNGDGVINSLDNPYTVFGTDFYTYELTAGWAYEGRNRALFPDRGMKITLSARYALPLSDVRYYQANFDFIRYVPLWGRWLISEQASVDYAAALGQELHADRDALALATRELLDRQLCAGAQAELGHDDLEHGDHRLA